MGNTAATGDPAVESTWRGEVPAADRKVTTLPPPLPKKAAAAPSTPPADSKAYLTAVARKETEARMRATWIVCKVKWAGLARTAKSKLGDRDGVAKLTDMSVKYAAQIDTLLPLGNQYAIVLAAVDMFNGDVDRAATWLLSTESALFVAEGMARKYFSFVEAQDRGASSVAPTPEVGALYTASWHHVFQAIAREGCSCYHDDHTNTIKYLPAQLRHGALLQPSQKDSSMGHHSPSDLRVHLQFETRKPVRVWVAVDHRMADAGEAPPWLQEYGFKPWMEDVVLVARTSVQYYVLFVSEVKHGHETWYIGKPATGLFKKTSKSAYESSFVFVTDASRDMAGAGRHMLTLALSRGVSSTVATDVGGGADLARRRSVAVPAAGARRRASSGRSSGVGVGGGAGAGAGATAMA